MSEGRSLAVSTTSPHPRISPPMPALACSPPTRSRVTEAPAPATDGPHWTLPAASPDTPAGGYIPRAPAPPPGDGCFPGLDFSRGSLLSNSPPDEQHALLPLPRTLFFAPDLHLVIHTVLRPCQTYVQVEGLFPFPRTALSPGYLPVYSDPSSRRAELGPVAHPCPLRRAWAPEMFAK